MQPRQILVGSFQQFLIPFVLGQFQNLLDFGDSFVKLVDGMDDGFQRGALLAQRLCIVGLVPDRCLTQFQFDFGEPIALYFVVKDTP